MVTSVVERPQLHRQQVDREHLAHGPIDADDVADGEGLFSDQEQTADDIGSGGLRRKADRDGEDAGGAEEDAEVDAELRQRRRDEQAGYAVKNHAPDEDFVVVVGRAGDKARSPPAGEPGKQEAAPQLEEGPQDLNGAPAGDDVKQRGEIHNRNAAV